MRLKGKPFVVFDVETNGLLVTVNKFHCGVVYDSMADKYIRFRPGELQSLVSYIKERQRMGFVAVAHNGIKYDVPAINKILGSEALQETFNPFFVDTLVLSRLIFSHLKTMGAEISNWKRGKIPGKLYGSHSLKAWGYRLGELKGDYGEQEEAWSFFNEDMLDYCEQDVRVTKKLYQLLVSKDYSETAITLEHKAAWLLAKMERNGFPFDTGGGLRLADTLQERFNELEKILKAAAPRIPDKVFVPKRDNAKMGYKAGVGIQRYKDFNPGSRQQIMWLLENLFEYMPDNHELYREKGELDEDGRPVTKTTLKLDDATFKFIATDQEAPAELRQFAEILSEYFMLSKRLGQLADGKAAWLKVVTPEGFIHGAVNPNGAVTGRATHSAPNMGQVPAGRAAYGPECRSLFGPNERFRGWVQVGTDASGLELRCLAHFMHEFDQGEYAYEVVNGDIHTKNQRAAGLPSRDNAKTFIYAYLYGAGDEKIGKIVRKGASEGKALKAAFLEQTPALGDLKDSIAEQLGAHFDVKKRKVVLTRNYLVGLDGRHVHVRSNHAALNTLLQSAGALVCKYWIVRTDELLRERGYLHGWEGDYAYMAWVHDEMQIACRKEIAEEVIQIAQLAMRETEAYFNFKVQLDADGKIGANWKDCH
ncbi:DNA polymerase [Chromobacterium haemolyticum]|uniref:DNA polymerase n=1 Tax=Chromobacterium haemolyticum TaxID=394935 RepID=UPI000D30F890|nr:DNA polymerase [Chromobacterium haemolyticum]PTU68614.1 DNA polymerase [Chromobacterium haemolyticum]